MPEDLLSLMREIGVSLHLDNADSFDFDSFFNEDDSDGKNVLDLQQSLLCNCGRSSILYHGKTALVFS